MPKPVLELFLASQGDCIQVIRYPGRWPADGPTWSIVRGREHKVLVAGLRQRCVAAEMATRMWTRIVAGNDPFEPSHAGGAET